jgi:aspartate/methionine/tyrosine aminotransferase
MSKHSSLSQRGQTAQHTQLRIDFEVFFEAMENLYHPVDNPDGAIPLNIAENRLSWHLLRDKMQHISCEQNIPDWVPSYTSALGAPEFREAMAGFMSRFLTHCPIDPEQLGMSAGATATVEVTSWILANRGDVAVFPAPCYPVYKQDIGNKGGIERYDLVTHHELSEIQQKPALEIAHLEKALEDIQAQGKRFRLLVLTSPDNPTGGIFPQEKLSIIADWCVEHEIHLVVNEIYGLSLINTQHPELASDYSEDIHFRSFAQIMQEKKSDYLHLWYAMSKDLGASGFRVGVVHSHNTAFLEAFNNLNAPHMVSNHTQWLFQLSLGDHDFMEKYIRHNQEALTESYLVVIRYLRKLSVPYVPARGSLFVWLDLSEFLKTQSQEAENAFWMDLYEKTGVLLTPGEGFGHSKRGQFRLVYSCVSKDEIQEAMKRLEKYLK